MGFNTEDRKNARFAHESRITLENIDLGIRCEGRIYNFSESGLYFESDSKLETEIEIFVGIEDSPFAYEPGTFEEYRATVKWRKPLEDASYFYGYGVELIEKVVQTLGADRIGEVREHPRKQSAIPIKIESDDESFDGVAENVSSGGAFIKSDMLSATGQFVKMEIPLKKKGKIARLVGKVTRTNLRGFGVKFFKSK